jgi:hypothetical protein
MDRTDTGAAKPAGTLRPRRIGFIGKGTLTPKETGLVWYIARCVAKLGHTVVLAKAAGVAKAVEEGVGYEAGSLEVVRTGVIEASDHTMIYPDSPLLIKLKARYPDIETRTDVAIITESNLDEWYDAVRTILTERKVALPE